MAMARRQGRDAKGRETMVNTVQNFCGYLLAAAFCLAAILLCGIAWNGLQNAFGWQWGLGIVAACVLARINFAVVVGLYYYAANMLGWPMAESIAFALPGMLILMPSIALGVLGLLTASAARR
jgi:hypothetical protein